MSSIPRRDYAALYGPTTGDRFRLADTDLVAQVERSLLTPGEELVFGGGKSVRDGMGQVPGVRNVDGALDLVITSVVVMDPIVGIVKADIGIKDGRIAGIGQAGNPYMQDGVDPCLIVGAGTQVLSGEGLVATAGGVDTHVHFISPGQVQHGLSAGVTTAAGPAPTTAPGRPTARPVRTTSPACCRRRRASRSTSGFWARATAANPTR